MHTPHRLAVLIALASLALAGCCPRPPAAPRPRPTGDLGAALDRAREALLAAHGAAHRERIERAVRQVGAFWRPSDGTADELVAFLKEHFIADPAELDRAFRRLESHVEQLEGQLVELGRVMRFHGEVDTGPNLAMDALFAALDPTAHLVEDLFRSKIAFVVLANFPLTTLPERLGQGDGWSRRRWAEVRLADRFGRRIPGAVQQRIAQAVSAADLYIAGYNLWMHHVLDAQGRRLFPRGLRLISHWNLRDDLKAAYAEKDGLARQRVIARVMDRIVTQTIPRAVIDRPDLDWNPFTNAVTRAPADTVEPPPAGAPARPPVEASAAPEPDARYAHLLACYRAVREADRYSPQAPTHVARRFDLEREIPVPRFRAMLVEVLSSPLLPRLAKIVEQRLGRKLEPHDLWFNGFRPRSGHREADLDAAVRQRYPDVAAFQADLPRILGALGFSAERRRELASHIVVEPARGAGQAVPTARREDRVRLHTRIPAGGMNYKGFNIALHELGHNVEMVFSLWFVDSPLMQGVPNTGFTEAIAFLFQYRDLEVLGFPPPGPEARRYHAMNELWSAMEISGVGLLDLEVWQWMYANPAATPAQLREAVIRIARSIWNRYFAPVLGHRDSTLLAIYSHLISNLLYLPDYALGQIVAFQIAEHLAKGGSFAAEVERLTRMGRVTPDLWMKHATGSPVRAAVLLEAAGKAIQAEEAEAARPR